MAKVIIAAETCKGCGLCIKACPQGILMLSKTMLNSKGYSPIECTDMEKCIGCAFCARMCPDCVLEVER